MPPRDLAEILRENDELELSDAGNGDGLGHQHAVPTLPHEHIHQLGCDPAPVVAHDLVSVRPEASQQESPPLPTTETATETPRRRRKREAPAAGANGNGAPDLAETFLLTGQVAGLLHMHHQSVLRIVARGDLPGVKVGNRVLIPAEAVATYIAGRQVHPKAWAVRLRGSARSQGSMLDLA